MKIADAWVEFCVVNSRRVAQEMGLVILAAGSPYRIERTPERRFLIEVPESTAAHCSHQLGIYCEEVRRNPYRKNRLVQKIFSVAPFPFFLWIGSLLWVYYLSQGSKGRALVEWGRMDTEAIWQKFEFWRIVTPLWFHGDMAHLLGNVGFGCFFFWFVVQTWGSVRGWSLILATGVLGNLFLALGYVAVPHLSIGASTAVMGGIGLLAGASAYQRKMAGEIGIGWLGPIGVSLFAGAALFALLGMGGENTDLAAHAWGWILGIYLGYRFSPFRPLQRSVQHEVPRSE